MPCKTAASLRSATEGASRTNCMQKTVLFAIAIALGLILPATRLGANAQTVVAAATPTPIPSPNTSPVLPYPAYGTPAPGIATTKQIPGVPRAHYARSSDRHRRCEVAGDGDSSRGARACAGKRQARARSGVAVAFGDRDDATLQRRINHKHEHRPDTANRKVSRVAAPLRATP